MLLFTYGVRGRTLSSRGICHEKDGEAPFYAQMILLRVEIK